MILLFISKCFLLNSNVISPMKFSFLNTYSYDLQHPGNLCLSYVIELKAGSVPWRVPLFRTQ